MLLHVLCNGNDARGLSTKIVWDRWAVDSTAVAGLVRFVFGALTVHRPASTNPGDIHALWGDCPDTNISGEVTLANLSDRCHCANRQIAGILWIK